MSHAVQVWALVGLAFLAGCDRDDDGLTNREERREYGTDPDAPDSDGDGVLDGDEVTQGSDPLDECSTEAPYEGGWNRSS